MRHDDEAPAVSVPKVQGPAVSRRERLQRLSAAPQPGCTARVIHAAFPGLEWTLRCHVLVASRHGKGQFAAENSMLFQLWPGSGSTPPSASPLRGSCRGDPQTTRPLAAAAGRPPTQIRQMSPPLRSGLISCGQGRGRTDDLPLFRRTLVPTELPGRALARGEADEGWAYLGDPDGTRTRDLRRDRAAR